MTEVYKELNAWNTLRKRPPILPRGPQQPHAVGNHQTPLPREVPYKSEALYGTEWGGAFPERATLDEPPLSGQDMRSLS